MIGQTQPRNFSHHRETWDCEPCCREVLGSLTLLLSAWVLLPNKISCFVSTCVSSDYSFLSVRQVPHLGPRKGPPSTAVSATPCLLHPSHPCTLLDVTGAPVWHLHTGNGPGCTDAGRFPWRPSSFAILEEVGKQRVCQNVLGLFLSFLGTSVRVSIMLVPPFCRDSSNIFTCIKKVNVKVKFLSLVRLFGTHGL